MKILMRNVGMTLHVIHKLRAEGIDNVQVNMDWQHLIMNGENLAEYAALLAAEGVLGHQHANSGWGTFDDDNMVGTIRFMETLELAVELRRAGYGENGERLGFDLYPYTEDAVAAARRSVLQWRFIDSAASRIDDAALRAAQNQKDAVAAYELVYAALGGGRQPAVSTSAPPAAKRSQIRRRHVWNPSTSRPPRSTLFPYTTLFRSGCSGGRTAQRAAVALHRLRRVADRRRRAASGAEPKGRRRRVRARLRGTRRVTQLVGLDVGTTGVKALALSPEGDVLARAEEGYDPSTPPPGGAEEDPGDGGRAADGDPAGPGGQPTAHGRPRLM